MTRVLFVAALSLFISTSAHAHKNRETKTVDNLFTSASRFAVKIVTSTSHIFNFEPEGGHGSGFIYEIRKNEKNEDIGVVFTNKHVVERDELNARQVELKFQTDTVIPETISGEVVYESNYNDFAVVEFKMSDLKRVKNQIRPAPMPKRGSPYLDFEKNYPTHFHGIQVAAQGSPLDADAATTIGYITAQENDSDFGQLIQTQTPINPGNSGGPLLTHYEMRFGEVIGMNVLKDPREGVDNVGYAIPIGTLTEEYKAWRKDPKKLSAKRRLNFLYDDTAKGDLEALGVKEIIAKERPDFFLHNEQALKVQDADPKSLLKTGDIIVTVDGQVIPTTYAINRAKSVSDGPVRVEVVRNGKLIAIDVPTEDYTEEENARETNFVYVSGLLFRENKKTHFNAYEPSTCLLSLHVKSSNLPLKLVALPSPRSLVVGVNIGGHDYKITNLADLEKVLSENRTAKFMRLDVREPMGYMVEDKVAIVTDRFGVAYHQNSTRSYTVPIMELVLQPQFSIADFAKQVQFSSTGHETQSWRNFVSCQDPLLIGTKEKQ